MEILKWTRAHQSKCGRFWCYKLPRFDREGVTPNGQQARYEGLTLAELKKLAESVAQPLGKPLIEILQLPLHSD